MRSWAVLSENSIRSSLRKMGVRGLAASPLHVGVFTLFFFGFPEFDGSRKFIACFILMWASAFARLALWWKSTKILERKGGIKLWRKLFALTSIAIALAWGVAIAMVPQNYGIGLPACMAFTMCMVLCAGSVSAYSFDLITNIAFNMLVSLPILTVICLAPAEKGLLPLTYALIANIAFMLYLCVNLHRGQISLLRQNEIVAEQGESLKIANLDLQQKSEVIGAMFQSIDEAFLFFDSAGICTNNPSERSQSLLGMDPIQKHICEILHVPEAQIESVKPWYRLLFSDRLSFDEIKLKGPGVIEVAAKERILKANFHALRDDKGTLKAIIFTGADVTREMKAQRRVDEERERADMILRVNENKVSFRVFLTDFERIITNLVTWNGENLQAAQRDLHTLKGAALMFGAKSLSQQVYASELEIRASATENLTTTVRKASENLRKRFFNWKHHETRIFTQLGVFEEDMIEISRRKLGELERRYSQSSSDAQLFSKITTDLLTNDFGDLLGTFEHHVNTTAAKVGKKTSFKVERPETPIFVPLGNYREPLRSLVHLFNNAVDHGLETPEERVAAGKPAEGSILLKYQRVIKDGKAWIEFSLTDDGRGFDVNRLRQVMAKKGKPVDVDASDLDIAMNIFNEGITTRETVTDLSGQGIGMGAVRESILKARGSLSILSTGPQGTTFLIRLPDTSFARNTTRETVRTA